MPSFNLQELANLTGSRLVGNPFYLISSFDELSTATPSDVSFLSNSRYKDLALKTQAGALCVDELFDLIEGKNYLISSDPSQLFQSIILLLLDKEASNSGFKGIHPTAVIHESAVIENHVTIGPHVVIDRNVLIGSYTVIMASSSIGASVRIGKNCLIHPNVVIRECCQLGDRVILQPGAVIGSCGFGYITNKQGYHEKLEQLGIVILEDDVEIGSNTAIDRARFKETRIGKGSKIDNLVQIGHNVQLGSHNLIVSQTGISGSAKTGKYVVMGGQVGVVGHISIADFTQIASRGGVSKSVPKGGQYGGTPVVPIHEFHKHRVHLHRLEKYAEKIAELEQRLALLESTQPVSS